MTNEETAVNGGEVATQPAPPSRPPVEGVLAEICTHLMDLDASLKRVHERVAASATGAELELAGHEQQERFDTIGERLEHIERAIERLANALLTKKETPPVKPAKRARAKPKKPARKRAW